MAAVSLRHLVNQPRTPPSRGAKPMTVAVTGATGRLGSRVVHRLLGCGSW
jgi:hypothetical protein